MENLKVLFFLCFIDLRIIRIIMYSIEKFILRLSSMDRVKSSRMDC